MNNLIGETIGSGRNTRNFGGPKGHEAHLLSNTQSEEKVLANNVGSYANTGQGGVRRVKMRQVPTGQQNLAQNANQGNRAGGHQSQAKERQQSRVRVRLQKRNNGMAHQMSDTHHNNNMSKEDSNKQHAGQSSFENMMDAVVSIHGGEVSLKGNTAQGANHRQTSVKRNQTDQSKTDTGRQFKQPISNFDSPAKRRDFYNKT